MATSADLADARYLQVQSVSKSVVAAVQALWGDVTPDRIIAALQGETGKQILNAVITGQLNVAQGAQAFVTASMMLQGAGLETLGTLVPGALAGVASDGRPLATLLMQPAYTTAYALAQGMSPDLASLRGLNQMAMMVSTMVADTARSGTSIAMAAEPSVVSYVRIVKPPACGRCLILAGRQYSYSEGFKRHPRCDCGMQPLSDSEWRKQATPEELLKQMTPEQREKALTKKGAEAFDLGADLGQVVNARRGMATAANGKKVTTEGTTKRGIGGKSLNSGFEKAEGKRYMRAKEARLMPEQILKQAHGDRDLQVALLKKHGYIT